MITGNKICLSTIILIFFFELMFAILFYTIYINQTIYTISHHI